ncbi:predicted protein [Nematostella vectensis]|uniref:Uncharacterized protein n=1 Tax=Nematostella vectensis TaxID=45351 RepID=A7RNI4_NEMVE|nr:predicted protein [Nematostella vectensis]|eukprot:XP_001638992.1 predicted protein [Nematostella vectensis]
MDDTGFDDSSSEDSDVELQKAFASGDLKVGLNKPAGFIPRAQREPFNNVEGLKRKYDQISQSLDWLERMDVTHKPTADEENDTAKDITTPDPSVHDDFKREMMFYKQAQEAAKLGLLKLQKLRVSTKRPEDYFAEMVKTDDHMQRVRSKLLSRQQAMERSEKAKKQREIKKYGKKVQQEVLEKRQKEKKDMLEAVKKYRKGKQTAPDFMKEDDFDVNAESKSKGKPQQRNQINHKRKAKDKKFGFGGKKRNIKRNTQKSTSDVSSFNSRKHSKAPKPNKPGVKRKNQRPGKSRRKKMKS